jgi:hypothetical protein
MPVDVVAATDLGWGLYPTDALTRCRCVTPRPSALAPARGGSEFLMAPVGQQVSRRSVHVSGPGQPVQGCGEQ